MSDIYGIAKSGLQAYKEGLATTGQNIANVGNKDYARREAPVSEVKSSMMFCKSLILLGLALK